MKILHLNSYYLGSKFYRNMFDIDSRHNQIDVFVPIAKQQDVIGEYGKYTSIKKVFNQYDRFLFWKKQFKIWHEMRNRFNLSEYDLFFGHSLFTNGYNLLKVKKRFKTPYIVTVRNTDINHFFKKRVFLRRIGRGILKEADAVVFVSESYRSKIEEYLPKRLLNDVLDKSVVITNGLDEYWLQNKGDLSSYERKDYNSLSVLFVGRIEKNKNLEYLCEALRILEREGTTVSLRVAGRVNDKEYFRVCQSVFSFNYLGHLSKEELLREYRSATLFALPSKTETFGISYLESISQGTPVVFTQDEGFDTNGHHGMFGYRTPMNNPVKFAETIMKVLVDREQLSKNCLIEVEKYSWRNVYSLYNDLFKSVVKQEEDNENEFR